MAFNNGLSKSSTQPSTDETVTHPVASQHSVTSTPPRSSLQQNSDVLNGIKSSNLLLSPLTSRETSPSRQLLSPNGIPRQTDLQQKAPSRSASVPADVLSTSSDTSNRRSVSAIAPAPAKPSASLNEAVNNLWRLQKQQGISNDGPSPRSQASNSRLRSLPSSGLRQQHSSPTRSSGTEVMESPRSRSNTMIHEKDAQVQTTQNVSTQPSDASLLKSPRGFTIHSTLETVDEGDQSISPTHQPSSSSSSFILKSVDTLPDQCTSDTSKDDMSNTEGSESNPLSRASTITQRPPDDKDKKSEPRRESSARSTFPVSRRPLSSVTQTKIRSANDTSQNMIVETETVPSIPQNLVGNPLGDRSGSGRREDSGTLRTRTSNETIKPKKEKKRSKKTPSLIAGANSTRADLFEAKVANAVDEDSSDSDETFVYESNPPEPRARHHRDHSRTPSVTSMQSLGGDRRIGRINSYLEGPRKLRGKRSMKFVSTHQHNSSVDDDSGEGGSTPKASQNKTAFPGDVSNRHLGVIDRGNSRDFTPSEQDSPFSQASRTRHLRGHDFRELSKPKSMQSMDRPSSRTSTYRKSESSPYELGRDGADEGTPLIGSVRSQRVRASRRVEPASEQIDFYDDHGRNWIGRFAGCVLMCIMVLLVVMGAATFLFATTKPLFDVSIQQIRNVLASEQEIMLDLLVEAVNPNIVTITVAEMDLNIFAKSIHLGGDELQSRDDPFPVYLPEHDSAGRTESAEVRIQGSVDRGTDPIEDPAADPSTMLLGRVREFDSALTFDPSPWSHLAQNASGELRLQRPGNKTEDGGSEKWEGVVQHSFELIVRGILKYQLPLSSRTFTASVGASVIVHPEAGIDGGGAMKIINVRKTFWEG